MLTATASGILLGVGPGIYTAPMGAAFAAEAALAAAPENGLGLDACLLKNELNGDPKSAARSLADLIRGTSATRWHEVLCNGERRAGLTGGGIFATSPLPEGTQETIVQKMLAHQRARKAGTESFDFENLTPWVVAKMTREEKLEAAEQFLAEMENLSRETWEKVERLAGKDDKVLSRIRTEYKMEAERMEKLRPQFPEGSEEALWMDALFASGVQMYSNLSTRLLGNTLNWRPQSTIEGVMGKNGITLPRTRIDLAQMVLTWVYRNFPVRRWVNGGLECRNSAGLLWAGDRFFHPAWAPRAIDTTWRRFLNTLGWKMGVRTEAGSDHYETVLTLRFGASARPAADPKGWMRTEDGAFSVSAMTPGDVTMLAEWEKLELALFLPEAMEEMCAVTLWNINALQPGDLKGMERLRMALKEESRRLTALFPDFEDEALKTLVRRLQYAAQNFCSQMDSSIREAARNFRENRLNWEDILGEISNPENSRPFYHDRRGLSLNLATYPLTTTFLFALDSFHKWHTEWWGGRWVASMTKSQETNGLLKTLGIRFPFRPGEDKVLQSYLSLFGWKMGVEEAGDNLVVTIDFGRNGPQ